MTRPEHRRLVWLSHLLAAALVLVSVGWPWSAVCPVPESAMFA